MDLFDIPDARGRVAGAEGTARPLGDVTGSETHILSVPEMATHAHQVQDSATSITAMTTEGSHSHTGTVQTAGAHTHTFDNMASFTSTGATDTDGPASEINLRQNVTSNTSTAGSHSHSSITLSSESHAHTVTDPTHAHTAQTVGSAVPFNIMQPTIFIGNMFMYSGRIRPRL
jgi:hypothetical protein